MVKAGIWGVGIGVPDRVLTNKDLEQMVDTSDEWITSRTGIRERRIADPAQATSDLALLAARKAMEDARVDASEIDLIIVATVTPDSMFPATACLVQAGIGAAQAAAFDLSAGCSGFIYALEIAARCVEAAIDEIACGEVTVAVRDAVIESRVIKEGEYLGISGGKILTTGTSINDVTMDLIAELMTENSSLITLYYGESVTAETAETLQAVLAERYAVDVEIYPGGQPVYDYLLSVE
jgi:hypothetical protein